ncbi:MAG: hypothetical protein QN178_10165 [Armatimonadota bacterium]|nr:hypothetical protein [Armatimonadota bacterium]
MIGYDEAVLDARLIAEARAAWGGRVPVRTMPFRRAEADPAAPLLVTFGAIGGTAGNDPTLAPPPSPACAALAAALQRAGVSPLCLMVRVDVGEVIVRGDVRAHDPKAVTAALRAVPALAAVVADAVCTALPRGAQLVTADYDATVERWVLVGAHGFVTAPWRRRFDPSAGWVEVS